MWVVSAAPAVKTDLVGVARTIPTMGRLTRTRACVRSISVPAAGTSTITVI